MQPHSSTNGPALLAAPLTLPHLHTHLLELAADGRIRNLKTGAFGPVSPEYVASMMSAVTLGVRRAHALEALPDAAACSVDDFVNTVDIRPLLGVLPDLAEMEATAAEHARPASAGDFARKVLVSIGFLSVAGGPRRVAACVLPAWQPLYLASQREGRASSKDCRAAGLLLLQRLAIRHDRVTPFALPNARTELLQWGLDEGFAPGTLTQALSSYHHAVKRLMTEEQVAYPTYPRGRTTCERHLGMLPDVVERARRAGCNASEVAIRDMHPLNLLKLLAPGVAEDVEDFLTMPRTRPLSQEARLTIIGTVSRYVAHAVQLDAAHSDAFASGNARLVYFLEHLEVESTAEGQPVRPVSRGLQARIGVTTEAPRVPLLMLLLAKETDAARSRSPIASANNTAFYPASVKQGVGTLWRIIEFVYGPLSESDPVGWQAILGQFARVQARLLYRSEGKQGASRTGKPVCLNVKNKPLAIRTVTLPQLVCIGLPVLANHVVALRARYDAALERALERGHDATHHAVVGARTEWHAWLTKYVVLALATDDGMRLSNYSYARVGPHAEIQPRFDRSERGALRLVGLKSHFTGTGGTQPAARLKMLRPSAAPDIERERIHTVAPGVMRMDLFLAYLEGPRAEMLLRQGLRDRSGTPVTPESYCIERETAGEYGGPFALYASDRSVRPDRAFNKNRASTEFGEALHWVVRHALGRTIPDWKDPDLRKTYRALFSMHISRLLIVTYWLGVRTDLGRDGIDRAMHLTNDTERALRDDYNAVDHVVREARRVRLHDCPEPWEHPNAYDDVMDRLYEFDVPEWSKLTDLPRPPHLTKDLIAPVTEALGTTPLPIRRSRTQQAA